MFVFKKIAKKSLFTLICLILTFIIITGFNETNLIISAQVQAPRTAEERRALQAELAELERKINEYEENVQGYQEQGTTLQREIRRLNSRISQINLQLRATAINLTELNEDIKITTDNIREAETKMEEKRNKIASAIRDIERNEEQNLIEILIANPSLSDFFGNINNIISVQNSLKNNLTSLEELRKEYINQKEELDEQKTSAEKLKAIQESQRRETESLRRERNRVLTVTRGREAEYQRLLAETRQTAAEIRARLFRMMDGGAMTFAQAYEHARFAEGATGVRAALLLAVLEQESGLGRNVGRCTYREAMHPRRDIPIFYRIIDELGMREELNAGRIKVSCPILTDGAFGGAMGPSQFIPSTWWGYRERIAAITGISPANPWRNQDAFVGTALLLRDNYNSAACRDFAASNRNTASEQTLRERCAAAQYYAGRSWRRFLSTYGASVLRRASRFERDIAVLHGRQAAR